LYAKKQKIEELNEQQKGEMHLLYFKFVDLKSVIDQIYKKYKLKYRVKNRNGFRDVFMIRMPWYNLLSFKYGELLKFLCGDYIATNRTSSDWWRDLVKIGVGSGALIGWFHDVVCNKEIRNWS
jgi:restriction endonuclease S subunit